MALRAISFLGLSVLIAVAWVLSENRRGIRWRPIVWGIGLQFVIGLLVLHTPLRNLIFSGMSISVDLLTRSTVEGSKFLFGPLAEDPKLGAIVAFQVLPVIIFVTAITAILQHLRVIPAVVHGIAWVMRRTLKTSGAETFSAALQIFLGIEGMPALRGYLIDMTRSELLTVMTSFMASIAGSVMVVYATFGAEPGHLLTASLMSAPAAIVMAKLLVPETGHPRTSGEEFIHVPVETRNLLDAAAQGTGLGLTLALNVGAMLIVFIGLVFLLNQLFLGASGHTFVGVMSFFFRPFAWLMGVPSNDVRIVAQLLGKKTVLNEFLGYLDMKTAIQNGQISPRSVTIATYALCGFSNPGSMGILIAGMNALIPERRADVTSLALKSLIAGMLASFMTACVAGVLVYA